MFKCSRHFNYTSFQGDCWDVISPQVCDAVRRSLLSYNATITMKTIVSQNFLFYCHMVSYSIGTCNLSVKLLIENRSTFQPLSPEVNAYPGISRSRDPALHFQSRSHSAMGIKEKYKKRGYNNKSNFSSFVHSHAG